MSGLGPDETAQARLVQAELFRLDGETDSVLRCTDEALALAEKLSPRMAKMGILPEIWFNRSVALIAADRLSEAKKSLREINGNLMKPLNKQDRMDFDFRKNAVSSWLMETEKSAGAEANVAAVGESPDEDADDLGFWSADEDEEDQLAAAGSTD